MIPPFRWLVATLSLALSLTPSVGAQQPAATPSDSLPFDPAVVRGRLDNGLRYYIRENARPEQRAELRLVVNVGSVLEDDDQRGIAHFLEHMAFNGTENFEKQELVDYLESIGMRFGPNLNAFTSFDETVYMLRVPTDDADILESGVQILEDWAHRQLLDPQEIDKERGVVIEEWRGGRGAEARMRDQQLPVLFHGSLYADRLPIGKPEVLEHVEPEVLERFYRDWYRPDLMAVVAVGDFEAGSVEALIKRHFGTWSASVDPRPRPSVDVPVTHPTLFAIATDPEASSSRVSVSYKRPRRQGGTFESYRQRLVERLYSGMFNNRLYELRQQADPPFVFGGAGLGSFLRNLETYDLFAVAEENGIGEGLEALLTEAERVSRYGFTASELEREKADLSRRLEQRFAERERQESARFAEAYVRSFLSGEPVPGIGFDLELTRSLLPGIEIDEVNRVVDEWISDEGRVILVSAPEKESLRVPSEEELLGIFAAVDAKELEPYEDLATDAPLLAEPPLPSPVVAAQSIPEIGLTTWELANGVRVLLKPTDFKADQILLRAYSPGGTSLAPDERFVSASLASVVVGRGGVGEFSLVDLDKKLAGKVVRVSPSISALTEGLTGSASPRDVETLFQLAYLYFDAPRKDSAAFLSFRSQISELLANRSADPAAAFADTISTIMTQGHFRARHLSTELLDEMDLDEAFAFYRDRFADASDFTFILVGNFDIEAIRPLIETYLGGLPSSGREEEWRDVGIDPPTGVIRKVVRKGIEPRARTQIIFAGPARFSVEEGTVLSSLADILQIRLRERVREDLGGTYGVTVGESLNGDPDPEYSLQISFGSDPERVEELTEVVLAEIRTMQEHGPREEDVAKVKEAQRRSKETNLKENGYWASQLQLYDQYGLDVRRIPTFERIEAWTGDQIREAAVRYLTLDDFVTVSLLPESSTP